MERKLNAASELCVSYVLGMPSWPKQAGRADLEAEGGGGEYMYKLHLNQSYQNVNS